MSPRVLIVSISKQVFGMAMLFSFIKTELVYNLITLLMIIIERPFCELIVLEVNEMQEMVPV